MARYRKFHSKYSLDKKHQSLSDGDTIWEKDWSTVRGPIIGNFGANAKRKYTDGNFTFVTSNIPSPEKKHTIADEGDVYTYEQVSGTTRSETINSKQPEYNSNDLRSYAYFGSAYELVKNSIENIVKNFPPKIYTNHSAFEIPPLPGDMLHDITTASDKDGNPYYILVNPFNVDLISQNPSLNGENAMHYMSLSYPFYKINVYNNGKVNCEYSIDSISIELNVNSKIDLDACDDYYQADYRLTNFGIIEPIYNINLKLSPYCPVNDPNNSPKKDIDNCNTDKSTRDANDTVIPCKNYYCPLTELNIYAYKLNDYWIYTSDKDNISIEANEDVLFSFFNELNGFEKQLLNRNTLPLYTNIFKEPQGDLMNLKWVNKTFTFPTIYDPNTTDHNSPFIDVSNASFSDYIKQISDLALLLDELFVDNIWRRLTHEAIKNFDWSWKTNDDSETSDYGAEGGERAHKVMDIIGRVFDDVKFNIDHIKNLNSITYNGLSNTSNIRLNEIGGHLGWEVPSIKDILYQEDIASQHPKISLSKEFFEVSENGITNIHWNWKNRYNWFPTIDPNVVNPDYCDIMFKRYLALSAKHIMQSKGTTHSIEMINALFGVGDNEIKLSNEVKQLSALKVVTPEEIELIRQYLSYKLTPSYEDGNEFASIPLKHVSYKVNGDYVDYLMPYFDKNYVYDGNLLYQGDGGWASIDESNEYDETLCYLKNLRSTDELLQLNPVNEVTEGEIFHVGTLYGYTYNTEYASHYFVIASGKSDLPDFIDNWLNIPYKVDTQSNEFIMLTQNELYDYISRVNTIKNGTLSPSDPNYKKVTYDKTNDGYLLYQKYFRKIEHLSKVISNNDGNNPHTGYGNYDFGEKYLQYMRNPLKYFYDNIDTLDEDILNILKDLVLPNENGYNLVDRNIDDINADENVEIKINYL